MSQRCGSQQVIEYHLTLFSLSLVLDHFFFLWGKSCAWVAVALLSNMFTATQTWSIKGPFYFQTTTQPSTIFCWNWQYLKSPKIIWEVVDMHKKCVWKDLSHNTSIYPFSEALSSLWSTCLTSFAHKSLIIFVSSIAMVGVDFCLVCLIDKSILKIFLLLSFFFNVF